MYPARNYPKTPGKRFTKKSLTIPGQTISVDQMLQRYAAGIPLINLGLEYPEDENDQQIIIKDLTDLDQYKEKVKTVGEALREAKKKKDLENQAVKQTPE